MSMCVVQGIPLSAETRGAWRRNGATILRMREPAETRAAIHGGGYHRVLNMGHRALPALHPSIEVWNTPRVVKSTSNREVFDEIMGDLAPAAPSGYQGEIWIKAPSTHGGGSATRVWLHGDLELPAGWTYQRHVDGDHWRINTVGAKVVQSHRRVDGVSDPRVRSYEWAGLGGTPMFIKDTVRVAATLFHTALETRNTILAWDVVSTDEEAFILEANSAPGINDATAERVIRMIEEQG